MAKSKNSDKAVGKIKVKQIGSVIGCTDRQRATVRGLGLRRMHHTVERLDTPEIRGMVNAVPHLAAIVIEQGGAARQPPKPPAPLRPSAPGSAASVEKGKENQRGSR